MDSSLTKPHTPFMRLLLIMDELRRKSFKQTPPSQQKKMMGLTLRQGSALSQIRLLTSEFPQGVALKTLAENLKITVPAASLLVESMVSKGFFERTPNPEDRRAICIRLSEKGVQLCDEFDSLLQRKLDTLASDLTAEELGVLGNIIEKYSTSYALQKALVFKTER